MVTRYTNFEMTPMHNALNKQQQSLLVVLLLANYAAFAAPATELPLVTVEAAAEATSADLGATATVTHLTAAAVRDAAGVVGASPFQAIANTPSVNFQSADPHGLTEVGFHETLKIRGVGQTGPASSRNIDDLPLTINPGGSKGIFDLENISGINVYRGAVPVGQALGFSNLPGKLNLMTRAPQATAATQMRLEGGSDEFKRLFLRQDSGQQGIFSGFLSTSDTQGDNWKGNGEFERRNLFGGIALDGGEAWRIELYAGDNQDERHNYRFFDYATVKNFANFERDWSNNPASVDYYDYNRQHFEDRFIYANLRGRLSNDIQLSIKPYYLNESGDYWFSSINPDPKKSRVLDWQIDHDNMGVVTQFAWQFTPTQLLQPGFWVQMQQPPGPPSTQQKYRVTNNGLVFDGWQVLSDNDQHRLLSPFLSYSGQFEALNVEAGLRLVNLRLGAMTAYNATGAAATATDADAARAAGGIDAMASAAEKTFNEWLPYFGLTWTFNPNTSVFTRLGRSYGLDVNLFPYYYAQKTLFASKGVSFQSLWDRLELETANNLDLGLHHAQDNWDIGLSTFYAQHQNKQSTIYDPTIGVRYPWNVADAERYGFELEGKWQINPAWQVNGNYTWNRFRYSQNLALSASTVIPSQGKQVVDTPEHMAKLGIRYQHEQWNAGLDARYIGERYGDVLNAEQVDAVTLFDMTGEYRFNRSLALTLNVLNLFDKQYVGPISAADDAIANFTAALNGVTGNGSTYQYGAPRTIFVGLSADF